MSTPTPRTNAVQATDMRTLCRKLRLCARQLEAELQAARAGAIQILEQEAGYARNTGDRPVAAAIEYCLERIRAIKP